MVRDYVIALYIRLSIEDYKYDSLSIENQRLILHEFALSLPEAGRAEILEFVDNGFSGANFERPQVQQLIEMVRGNKIDCIPDHHQPIVDRETFQQAQDALRRYTAPVKKNKEYPLRGKVVCGCCGHALSRTPYKTPYYYCRYSQVSENLPCHGLRVDAAELLQAVFTTLQKQMDAVAGEGKDIPAALDAFQAQQDEYRQQAEALQDGKRHLYEQYLLQEIDLDTYKTKKAERHGRKFCVGDNRQSQEWW